MEGTFSEPRRYVLKRGADARSGESQPRTAAAPAADPKLVRRTYLVNPTLPHANQQSATSGHVYSIKVHDFGKQWVEVSWGKSECRPGKKGRKGASPNKERNEQRAMARAKGEIRRKCIAIGADHLVTFTYRTNVQDRERVLEDLDRLRRMLARAGNPIPYVCVLECQKRGAIHPHFGVKGFQDVRLLRRCWYKIVGKGLGQVNVSGPKRRGTPAKLGRYMSKYVSKDFAGRLPREFGEHRYFCSLGINVPNERYQIVLSHEPDDLPGKFYSLVFHEVLRRIGDHCSIQHWSGEGGRHGWLSGYEDPSCRWILS